MGFPGSIPSPLVGEGQGEGEGEEPGREPTVHYGATNLYPDSGSHRNDGGETVPAVTIG